ncbi:MAG: tetratricopeptide repeat protein [bacterium]|nr:tetratricopeptide repeat protein [bacterium]
MLRDSRRKALALGVLLILTVAAFSGALGNDFVWDDRGFILDTPELRHTKHIPLVFHPKLYFDRFQEGSWRPVETLSHFLTVGLFRYWAPGHNAFDLLLYTMVVWLVYGLAIQMGMGELAAFIAAALFAVHPVHVEPVVVSALRADVLSAIFVLAAFVCLIKADAQSHRAMWWVATLVFYALGLLSKEMALVFPFLLVAYDVLRARQGRLPLGVKWIRFRYVTVLATAGLYLFLRFGPYAGPPHSYTYVGGSLGSAILTMLGIIVQYARLLLVPLRLNVDYVVRPIESLASPQALAGLGVLAAMVVAVTLGYRRWPLMGFALAWLLLSLLPVANLVPLENPMAERYLFIPSMGLCWAAGLAAAGGIERAAAAESKARASAVWAVVGFAIVALGVRTALWTRAWKDEMTLWSATVVASPESARAHLNLASALILRGQWEAGRSEIERSLALEPDKAGALHNLGLIEAHEGRWAEAEAAYRRSLELQPDSPATLYNLARALLAQGKGADTAIWLLGQAVSFKPLFTDAYLLTGNLLADQGKTDEAAQAYRRAVEVDPESAKAHSSLGNAERALGRPEAAEAAYKRAIELQPDSAEAHFNLASLYGEQGRYRETIAELERAVAADPTMAVAHKNLGLLYLKVMRNPARARLHLQRVLDLAPNHPEALEIRRLLDSLPSY